MALQEDDPYLSMLDLDAVSSTNDLRSVSTDGTDLVPSNPAPTSTVALWDVMRTLQAKQSEVDLVKNVLVSLAQSHTQMIDNVNQACRVIQGTHQAVAETKQEVAGLKSQLASFCRSQRFNELTRSYPSTYRIARLVYSVGYPTTPEFTWLRCLMSFRTVTDSLGHAIPALFFPRAGQPIWKHLFKKYLLKEAFDVFQFMGPNEGPLREAVHTLSEQAADAMFPFDPIQKVRSYNRWPQIVVPLLPELHEMLENMRHLPEYAEERARMLKHIRRARVRLLPGHRMSVDGVLSASALSDLTRDATRTLLGTTWTFNLLQPHHLPQEVLANPALGRLRKTIGLPERVSHLDWGWVERTDLPVQSFDEVWQSLPWSDVEDAPARGKKRTSNAAALPPRH